MQNLEKPLDAAVLAVGAVKRHEGNVVAAGNKTAHKVPRRKVEQVNGGESRLKKGRAHLRRGLEGDLPLVRPPTANDDDALTRQLFSVHRCPFATAHMR